METLRRAASFFRILSGAGEILSWICPAPDGRTDGKLCDKIKPVEWIRKIRYHDASEKRSPSGNHYGFAFDGKNVLIGSDGENIQYQQNPVFVILTWQKQWLNTARTIFLHRLDSLCSHRQISQIRVYCHYFSKEKYNQYLNSRGQRLKHCPFSHFRYFLQQNPS